MQRSLGGCCPLVTTVCPAGTVSVPVRFGLPRLPSGVELGYRRASSCRISQLSSQRRIIVMAETDGATCRATCRAVPDRRYDLSESGPARRPRAIASS